MYYIVCIVNVAVIFVTLFRNVAILVTHVALTASNALNCCGIWWLVWLRLLSGLVLLLGKGNIILWIGNNFILCHMAPLAAWQSNFHLISCYSEALFSVEHKHILHATQGLHVIQYMRDTSNHDITLSTPVARLKSSDVARSATMPKSTTAKPAVAIKRVESTPAGKRKYYWAVAAHRAVSCFSLHLLCWITELQVTVFGLLLTEINWWNCWKDRSFDFYLSMH